MITMTSTEANIIALELAATVLHNMSRDNPAELQTKAEVDQVGQALSMVAETLQKQAFKLRWQDAFEIILAKP
jgi:hypothetical protein